MKVNEIISEGLESSQGGLPQLLAALKTALKNGQFGMFVSPRRMSQLKETDNSIMFTIPSSADRYGDPMTKDSDIVKVLEKAAKTAGISVPLFVKIGNYSPPTEHRRGPDQGKISGPAKVRVIISTDAIPKVSWDDPKYRADEHGPGRTFKID